MNRARHRPGGQHTWRFGRLLGASFMGLLLAACADPPTDKTAAGGADLDARADDDDIAEKQAPPAMALKGLGADGRRMKVIVLPGEASVEVDGLAARRRDGIIELTGKVGEKHQLRVFDESRTGELEVVIEDGQTSPSVVDLSALAAPRRPLVAGPAATEDPKAPPAGPTPPSAVLLSDEFK